MLRKTQVDIIKALDRADNLPAGHVDKDEAFKLVKAEYQACAELEQLWYYRFKRANVPRLVGTVRQAYDLCAVLCLLMGNDLLKKVVINSPDVNKHAHAHYSKGEIHFKFDYISLETLMHELAHHMAGTWVGHGETYCNVLNMIFYVTYEHLAGRKCKKDWKF